MSFFSAVLMYVTFYRFRLDKSTGLLAILFAVTYLLLGRFIDAKFKNEKHATALFYLTGLTFVILVVPFQFGKVWISLGWLAEGVALTIYGILNDLKSFRKSGYIINILCTISFILIDVVWQGYLFPYKYFAITAGSILILGAYIYKNQQFGKFEKINKYISIINLWFYSIYF